MKKTFKLLLVLSALFFFSPQAALADNSTTVASYADKVGEKLGIGIANIGTGVLLLEIPKNVILTSRNEGPLYGMTAGLIKGVLHTAGRTLSGIVDTATFLFPTGASVKPEFISQDYNKENTYGY